MISIGLQKQSQFEMLLMFMKLFIVTLIINLMGIPTGQNSKPAYVFY